ncbi:hypothetical protein [Pseudarthrobacter equi]|uniref:hypothetical protein n=1 Tax=Pseudarthrobacter equi TaxID=728066 RepID=UPI0028D473EC|nr:hypothetical protein [Pseudarthrobacter equi]
MDHTFRGGSGSVGRPGGNHGDDDAPHHCVSVTFPVGDAGPHRDSPAAAGCSPGTVAYALTQSDANAYACSDTDTGAESVGTGRNSQPDAGTFALTWPDAYAQAHSDTNAHAYPVANTYGNAHAFTRSVAEPDAHYYASANSNAASDAGPYTGAHSYAHPDDVCPDADSTSAVVRAAQPGADLHRHSDPHRRSHPNAAALRHLACNGPLGRQFLGPGRTKPLARTGNTQPRPVPWAVGNEAPAWTTT